jgi:hypothetical protein
MPTQLPTPPRAAFLHSAVYRVLLGCNPLSSYLPRCTLISMIRYQVGYVTVVVVCQGKSSRLIE